MKFKVCGLFNDENIHQVANLNPDYIGHIFWEKSVRYVSGETPKINNIKKTGVFYNSNKEYIFQMIEKHSLQCIQLHGDESQDFCKKIYKTGVEVIKSFRVDESFDFKLLKYYNLVKSLYI